VRLQRWAVLVLRSWHWQVEGPRLFLEDDWGIMERVGVERSCLVVIKGGFQEEADLDELGPRKMKR
jgi:hypothetical protein